MVITVIVVAEPGRRTERAHRILDLLLLHVQQIPKILLQLTGLKG